MPVRRSRRSSVEPRLQRRQKIEITISQVGVTRPAANGNLNAPCLLIGSKFLPKLGRADAVASVFGEKNLCPKADPTVETGGMAATWGYAASRPVRNFLNLFFWPVIKTKNCSHAEA